jgi:hypothetical protein
VYQKINELQTLTLAQHKKQVPVFSEASAEVTGAGDCLPTVNVTPPYQICKIHLLHIELTVISTFVLG